MEVSFDLERALVSICGFVSSNMHFCCDNMNSDLANINVDDPTSNFDEIDPCTSPTLDALDAYADTPCYLHHANRLLLNTPRPVDITCVGVYQNHVGIYHS